jgi:hypothetical protein
MAERRDTMNPDTRKKLEDIIAHYGSVYAFCKAWELTQSAING